MSQQTGVIHDLGYRGYTGPREGLGQVAWTLFITGLRHAYGLGRSGRSKALPFTLLGIMLLPAAIMVGTVAMVDLPELPTTYAGYPSTMQVLVSLFAAAQAPVLFSRDLRHRSIVLYLARPLPPRMFALVRWASLTVAVLIFTLVPTLLLYAGALLSGLDAGEETPPFLKAAVLQVLLAAMLAGITGLIASWALRRGFAVVASIVVLIVVVGVVMIVQSIAHFEEISTVGELAGLVSPWSIHNGIAKEWDASTNALGTMSAAWTAGYVAAALAIVAGCLALLVARFTKVGAR